MGRRPVTWPGTFAGGTNGTKFGVLRNKKKNVKVYGGRRGERGPAGHGASMVPSW